jgi:hypothetical protein
MAPAMQSGEQLCPMAAIAQCDLACLFTAGRGAMAPVFFSRLRKALFWQQYREEFIALLKKEIANLYARSQKDGDWELLVRLNGTTDIRWENYPVTYKGKTYKNIFAVFPDTQFYDYTKLSNRKDIPKNYDLTFSYSGLPGFSRFVDQALQNKMRIAVVFRNIASIPKKFLNRKVLPGDNSDIRHLEPKNCIVALYAKGKAKKDYSGFVIDRPVIYLKAA